MKKGINILLGVIGLLVFLFVSYSIYNYISVLKEIDEIVVMSDINKEVPKEDMIRNLSDRYNNKDIIMRIVFDSLKIDSVVTKGTDNSYYLNHDPYKKKSVLGSIFMDYRNDIHDSKINIYGHNSKTYDVPFKKLEKYLDESFYKSNTTFIVYDEDGEHTYKIFSIYSIKKNDNTHMKVNFESNEELFNYMKDLNNKSRYNTDVDIELNDKYILLQTCLYNKKLGDYLIIIAKEIKNV